MASSAPSPWALLSFSPALARPHHLDFPNDDEEGGRTIILGVGHDLLSLEDRDIFNARAGGFLWGPTGGQG